MIAKGSICKKMAGREAGRYCIVLNVEGKFAQISGVRKYGMCRPKRCNLKHLKATKFVIKIDSEKQEDLVKSIYNSGILTRMGLKKDKRARYTKKAMWSAPKIKAAAKPKAEAKTEKKVPTGASARGQAPKKEKADVKTEAKKKPSKK